MRTFFTFLAFLILTVAATGGEVKGTVSSVDADKNTITLTIDGKDQTFALSKDTKITTAAKGKKKKPGTETTVDLKEIKAGSEATLDAEKKDDKTVVNSVKIAPPAKKKKKKTT